MSKAASLIVCYIVAMLMVACADYTPDPALTHVAEIVEDNPKAALQALDTINVARLGEADRHYYDLLTIKANDKAYVVHTSDSLILDVINYYESHQSQGHYPEALYYGGRVYSDLGDYPTSLQYFQQALDLLPADEEHRHLRSNVLAQTGRLLENLRMYNQAVPYVDEALTLDSIEGNPFNMAYTHEQRGVLAMKTGDLDTAQIHFEKAREWAKRVSDEHVADIEVELASVALRKGEIAEAKTLIDNCIDRVIDDYKSLALYYAVDIYQKAGVLDTAYIYAYELAHNTDRSNRRYGFRYLLSDDLIGFSSPDSLRSYVKSYQQETDYYMSRRDSEQALIQNAYYNYKRQVAQREAAEKKKKEAWMFGGIVGLIAVVLAIIVLMLKIRNKRAIIELKNSLDDLAALQAMLGIKTEANDINQQSDNDNMEERDNVKSLREQFRSQLLSFSDGADEVTIPKYICESAEYEQIRQFLAQGKSVPENHEIWDGLERLFNENNGDLNKKLRLLTGGDLKTHELHTIYLIKCGVNPSQLTTLLAKTKGTLSYRRRSLCVKIVGEELGPTVLDNIIRRM